ncbi:hypothetical protein FACS1894122_15070 [Alphaproteobacteria bacterium]|nr:hypothetical protein FACS1894122_15070 [Alphaproteobacteria bacterium]
MTGPGTANLAAIERGRDYISYFLHTYCWCRLARQEDRKEALESYIKESMLHKPMCVSVSTFVDEVSVSANALANDSKFLDAVDAQLERIRKQVEPQKELFFKAIDEALSAVSAYRAEYMAKNKIDSIYEIDLASRKKLAEEIIADLKKAGLFKEDLYGSAIYNKISSKLDICDSENPSVVQWVFWNDFL